VKGYYAAVAAYYQQHLSIAWAVDH